MTTKTLGVFGGWAVGEGAAAWGRVMPGFWADEFGSMPALRTLQTGGHTINQSTAKALGMRRGQVKSGVEAIKVDNGLTNNFHGKIMSDGSYINPHTGRTLGNIKHYAQ